MSKVFVLLGSRSRAHAQTKYFAVSTVAKTWAAAELCRCSGLMDLKPTTLIVTWKKRIPPEGSEAAGTTRFPPENECLKGSARWGGTYTLSPVARSPTTLS